jgi:hypothetical protein
VNAGLPFNQVQPGARIRISYLPIGKQRTSASLDAADELRADPEKWRGFRSRKNVSDTNAATPAPRMRVQDPCSSSNTTAQRPLRPSTWSQASGRSAIVLPYRGPRIGCAATIESQSATSCGLMGRYRRLTSASGW